MSTESQTPVCRGEKRPLNDDKDHPLPDRKTYPIEQAAMPRRKRETKAKPQAHRYTSYAEKLTDPRWQKKRLLVMERDEWECQDCGATDTTLHVHHCYYERGGPWETDERALLTLCASCHDTRQDIEDEARRSLGLLFGRLVRTTRQRDFLAVADMINAMASGTDGMCVVNRSGLRALEAVVRKVQAAVGCAQDLNLAVRAQFPDDQKQHTEGA